MKNIKTILRPKKNVEEIIFFQPTLPNVYFSPSSYRNSEVAREFKKFIESLENLTIASIAFIPVTEENFEDCIDRNQDRGWTTYEGFGPDRKIHTVDPIVIRGQNLPEFKIQFNRYPDVNHAYVQAQGFEASISDGARKMIQEQIPEQILKHNLENILEFLKDKKRGQAKVNSYKYINEQSKYLDELRTAIENE